MKKALVIFSALFLILTYSFNAGAQDKKTMRKTFKAISEERKGYIKLIKDKAVKEARKQAKEYEKEEGWQVFPGDRPMDKSLEQCWINQYEQKPSEDGTLGPAYIWASGNAVAQTKSAAKMQAIELAKVELAGQLKTHVAALTTSNIANAQISGIDAETEQNIVQSAKNLTSATLTQIKPILVLMRTQLPKKALKKNNKKQLAPGTVEVQVMLFYDLYQVDLQSREAIKEELKKKMEMNEEELKNVLGI